MYKKLRLRLALASTAATGLILALLTAAALHLAERQLNFRSREAFEQAASSALNTLAGGGTLDYGWLSRTESGSGLLLDLSNGETSILYNSLRQNGERVELFRKARESVPEEFDWGAPPENPFLPEKISYQMKSDNGEWYYVQSAKIPAGESGWLRFCALKSEAPDRFQIFRLRLGFGILIAAATVLLFLYSLYFAGRTLRPIEENQKRQSAFVAAASHELRSPLSVIRAGLSALETSPKEAERFIAPMNEECERMARLVDDMLTLAGADNRSWSIRFEKTGLETLILNAAEKFELPAAEKSVSISVSFPKDVVLPCRCDPQRMEQVLTILLDNAVRYSPEGGRIRIAATRSHGGNQIRVSDNGPGIPDGCKQRVFERFYRADSSRNEKGHYGLGLSIASEIAALHHGTLDVEDTPGGGCTFVCWIPE